MDRTPTVSVVVAAYRPGDGFDRVIASLDAQTMPQEEFETIVVDDGSPDDTFERLTAFVATRPNMRVERIENSGWPSRPRNVGTGLARGEYVLYVDHDDSLYPDALRRLAEYAAETGADVVTGKESQTRSVWWGAHPFKDGNIPNIVPGGDIHRLMPMVPHKLYRRAFLAEHDIRFPEGRRQLWEDVFVNVAAWRHARVIALLADTPVYLWHQTEDNNSSTYGPAGDEFWDRLDVLFPFIDRALDAPGYERARRDELLHQWRSRALLRFTKLAGTADPAQAERTLPRARSLQARFVPEELDPLLGTRAWRRSVLVRQGRVDLLGELYRAEAAPKVQVRASGVAWRDGALELRVTGRWVHADGGPLRVLTRGDRLVRDLPQAVLDAVPPESADATDSLAGVELRVGVFLKAQHLLWELAVVSTPEWEPVGDDAVTPVVRAVVRLDPTTAAGGGPLPNGVWETTAEMRWDGASRTKGVRADLGRLPAVVGGMGAVAYTDKRGLLMLDTSGSVRDVVREGGLAPGRVRGSVRRFVVPLPRVHGHADTVVPVVIRFQPVGGGDPTTVRGVVRSSRADVRIEAGGRVPAGRYRLSFAVDGGEERAGRWIAVVGPLGALTLGNARTPPAPGRAERARWKLGRVRGS